MRIAAAAARAGRDPAGVCLLAASKTHPAALLEEAHRAGQARFGENYVQEAVDKMDALAHGAAPPGHGGRIEWHLIGPLQSNKTRVVAERFDWVHTVDREKIAQRLSAQRPRASGALQVLVQVNVSAEATKSGASPDDVPALAHAVATMPGLQLRGLMAIPEPTPEIPLQRARFRQVRALFEALVRDGLALDTLSMGMSDDLEVAIEEGATMVRVGTAIFGARARNAAAVDVPASLAAR